MGRSHSQANPSTVLIRPAVFTWVRVCFTITCLKEHRTRYTFHSHGGAGLDCMPRRLRFITASSDTTPIYNWLIVVYSFSVCKRERLDYSVWGRLTESKWELSSYLALLNWGWRQVKNELTDGSHGLFFSSATGCSGMWCQWPGWAMSQYSKMTSSLHPLFFMITDWWKEWMHFHHIAFFPPNLPCSFRSVVIKRARRRGKEAIEESWDAAGRYCLMLTDILPCVY